MASVQCYKLINSIHSFTLSEDGIASDGLLGVLHAVSQHFGAPNWGKHWDASS